MSWDILRQSFYLSESGLLFSLIIFNRGFHMPCRSYEDYCNRDYSKLTENNDKLAALLCEACNIICNRNVAQDMGNNLFDWWEKHQIADRKAQEDEERNLMADLATQETIKRTAERNAAEIRKRLKKK